MYKYKCRGCSVQEHCIDQSDTAPGAKVMIRNAFAARTDTMSTWATLQKSCLLVKDDEEREHRAKEGSMLGRRINEARTKTEQQEISDIDEAIQPVAQLQDDSSNRSDSLKPIVMIVSDPASADGADASTPAKTGPPITVHPGGVADTITFATAPLDEQPDTKESGIFWLTIRASQRRISLPVSGKLVLGRFDPAVTLPLDVDLTFEDQDAITVSRRHAKVVGVDGYHTIEDLNSSNGLFINGKQIPTRRVHQLQPGDHVVLGKLKMVYDSVPLEFLDMLSRSEVDQVHHFLFHTHTGRKMTIAPRDDITIGRFDASNNTPSNINLVGDGDVATYVSRQHARISWSDYKPLIEDLDSSCGTRLNGKALPPRETAPLMPGDHISLGGCVLAYDVEL